MTTTVAVLLTAATPPMPRRELSDVLEEFRHEAQVFATNGMTQEAAVRERFVAEVARSAERWLTFLSETDAMLQTGRSREWLRSKFAAWEASGDARMAGRDRQYRQAVLPIRTQASGSRQAGRETARAIKAVRGRATR